MLPVLWLGGWWLAGCDSNSRVVGEGHGLSPEAYHISPSSAVLDADGLTATFSVVGGGEPFSWSVTDPALGSVSESTGRTVNYQRTPGVEGVNTIEVVDDNGNRAQASVLQ